MVIKGAFASSTAGQIHGQVNMQPPDLNISACRINDARVDSIPISGAPAPKEPYIFGCQSLDRGLSDRLIYASQFCTENARIFRDDVVHADDLR